MSRRTASRGFCLLRRARHLNTTAPKLWESFLILRKRASSLDSISERYVKQTLDALARKGKTIIVIAHRLSTVKNADKIVVIDKGQVVEAGTHEELFNSNGMYHRLWKEQFDEVG